MNTTISEDVYDAIIVGGGISGLVFLKYGRDKGLQCLVLEGAADIGGLWRDLPPWQDIQNKISDFAINGIPLTGTSQPHIHQFIKTWVQEYALDPYIQLQSPVTSVSRGADYWNVSTPEDSYIARNLIIASGIQNEPFMPDVKRTDTDIIERHSSEMFDPGKFMDSRVTVVGGGTSSWDLLEQALKHDAKKIHWVYRNIKWSLPTNSSKQHLWPNLREMAFLQSVFRSIDGLNAFLRWLLGFKYWLLNLDSIKPKHQFDQRKHQLIPGRSLMCDKLDRIRRHRSEVNEIEGKMIRLANHETFNTDIVAWATGYRMNLSYLRLSEYEHITRVDELFPRLGYLMKSLDYPNMFFVGMPLLGSTSATPFISAVESKTIVAHILGKCRIPDEPILHQINHWDLFRYFSRFDKYNYPSFGSAIAFFSRALFYMLRPGLTVRV